MCGIVAICDASGPVSRAEVSAALDAISHRGPDGRGVWRAADGRAVLGHTRLSVIDLEGGAQPIESEDGGCVVAVNGEFYDHRRIRAELEAQGHRFKTQSDSEIALHLYESHGMGFLEHLRGEFALVLWDAKARTLIAARDRFGIKPLHWCRRGERVWLASEAKALFAAGVEARWDEAAFHQCAHAQYLLPDQTLFKDVHQIPPGCALRVRDGSVELIRYWDLDHPRGEPVVEDERELVEGLRRHLEEAVRLRLEADVPVACYLSGGLDSCAVLGLAARHSPRPLTAFTLSFDEAAYDELAIAREMADKAGARLVPVKVSQQDLMANLGAAAVHGEGLIINGHQAAKYLLSRAVRDEGIKVVLTGEGADEVVAGYPHLRRDLWSASGDGTALAKLEASNPVARGIMLPHGDALSLEAVRARLGSVPAFLEAKATLGRRVDGVLSAGFKARFAGRDAYAALIDAVDAGGQMEGRHQVRQSLYLWSKLCLANYILKLVGDGTEMAHSVEGRLPFLDHPLVAFLRRVPVDMMIRGQVEKHILREAARPVLTETVYRRQKHPLYAPPWRAEAGGEALQDALRSRGFGEIPFFDQARVLALLDRWPEMTRAEQVAHDPVIMMALSAHHLQEGLGL